MRRPLALILLALAAAPAAHAATPTTPPLALYGPSGGETHLSRLDPVTLAPAEPRTVVPEWHAGYGVAPDGSQAAFTVSTNGTSATPGSGRVGMRVIDLTTLETVVDFRLGGAASAIGWLAPRRIVAMTQSGGGVVVADPVTGQFRRTGRGAGPPCTDPHGKATTRRALVVLLGSTLNAIDRDGTRRSVRLRGMSDLCWRLGLAVDRVRELAFVSGVGPHVAHVNLRTMRVTYRRVGPTRATRVDRTRTALFGTWIAAAHSGSRGLPRGVELIDRLGDSRRMLDARAGALAVAGERLLTYDGRFTPGGTRGLRAYDLAGRRRYTLLRDEVVNRVEVLGGFAYAFTPAGLRVVDLRERRVVSRSAFDPRTEVHFVLPERAGL